MGEIEAPKFEFGLQTARDYLSTKVPMAGLIGTALGASTGYYLGEVMAVYALSYGFGAAFISTAYFGTTYLLKCTTQRDDVITHAASGGLNAAWLITGLAGYKRGIMGTVCAAAAGVAYKTGSDWTATSSRQAWVNHRIHTIQYSKPRILDVRRPMFPPKSGASIIPSERDKGK